MVNVPDKEIQIIVYFDSTDYWFDRQKSVLIQYWNIHQSLHPLSSCPHKSEYRKNEIPENYC